MVIQTARSLLHKQPIRWLCLLIWVIASLSLLLMPGRPPSDPPIPPSLIWETIFIVGHLVTFGGFTAWQWWALEPYMPPRRALICAVVLALIFSPITELLQSFSPYREVSLFDIATNAVATFVVAALIDRYTR